jgi:hypothetical protein
MTINTISIKIAKMIGVSQLASVFNIILAILLLLEFYSATWINLLSSIYFGEIPKACNFAIQA